MKNIKLFVFAILLSLNSFSQGFYFDWVNQISKASINDVFIDADGNSYVTGLRLLSKYNALGVLEWQTNIGGSGNIDGKSIKVDNLGNIYLAGLFNGSTVDFDPSTSFSFGTPVGNDDIFFAKYSPIGDFLWVKKIGSNGNDVANDIVIDSDYNLIITGGFSQTTDFDPSLTNAVNLSTPNNTFNISSVFVAKYNTNGDYLWALNSTGGNSPEGISLGLDSLNNIFVTGNFGPGSVDMNPLGAGSATDGGAGGIFLAKYNSTGLFQWAKGIGGPNNEVVAEMSIDADGKILLTGNFDGTTDFDPVGTFTLSNIGNATDVFVAKYTNDGVLEWAKQIGAIDYDWPNSISTDKNNNVYITGIFDNSVDFDPGAGTFVLTNPTNSSEIFLLKLNINGEFINAEKFGSTGTDVGYVVRTDSNDGIYIGGEFNLTVDFDPDIIQIYNLTAPTGDLFLLKLFQQSSAGTSIYENNNSLTLSPNPTTSKISVKSNAELIGSQFIIYDQLGKEVKSGKITSVDTEIDLSNLIEGMYLLKVGTEMKGSFKIIKQ
jgi:hypothetical protein